MGYETFFGGELEFDKPLGSTFEKFLKSFCAIRHMKRDVQELKKLDPKWRDHSFHGEIGPYGEWYVGYEAAGGHTYYAGDTSVIDYNSCESLPGLWCDWEICKGANKYYLRPVDGKNYEYLEWLHYLIENFIAPSGYKLTGEIEWSGEEDDDRGIIHVKDNEMSVSYAEIVYSDPVPYNGRK